MYRVLRGFHYYTGFLMLGFVLMYFVSGYGLIHSNWFGDNPPLVKERTEHLARIPADDEAADSSFLEFLSQSFDLSGRGRFVARSDSGEYRFEFNRPGYRADIRLSPDGEVQVREQIFGLHRTLVGFHRFHGYQGGSFFKLWAVFYDLASLSMIIFAVTGVWMWWKLTPRSKRGLGWFLLASSFVLTLATFLYFLYRT